MTRRQRTGAKERANTRSEARVEAIPLPERAAPQALIGVLGVAIAAAILFSQAIPLVLNS